MSCTNNTCSSTFTIPAPTPVQWRRPAFIAAIVALAESFREALDMRRDLNRTHDLSDE